jgi:hypothetical protein
LPHQTNNTTTQCIVESIKFDLNNQIANVTAIILDETPYSYYWKDSYDSYSSVGWEDVKDTYSTKAEVPTNENDVKDNH